MCRQAAARGAAATTGHRSMPGRLLLMLQRHQLLNIRWRRSQCHDVRVELRARRQHNHARGILVPHFHWTREVWRGARPGCMWWAALWAYPPALSNPVSAAATAAATTLPAALPALTSTVTSEPTAGQLPSRLWRLEEELQCGLHLFRRQGFESPAVVPVNPRPSWRVQVRLGGLLRGVRALQ